MENVHRKCVIFLVAQNHAGKTRIANTLKALYDLFEHYSIREIITNRQQAATNDAPLEDRTQISKFSEFTKEKECPNTFILEALHRFHQSGNRICIIESLRCPGEGKWVTGEEIKTLFPDTDFLVIGLIAKEDERLRRFLDPSRTDNIAKDLTIEKFQEHEEMVNHGTYPWEQNVEETLRYAHYTIDNNDGMFDETITKLKNAIASIYTP